MSERWLTYAEVGELLGMSPEAVRQRARRHDWPTRRDNQQNRPTHIQIPNGAAFRPGVRPGARPPGQPPVRPPVRTSVQPGEAATVADAMAALRAGRQAAEAERDVARAEAAEARREVQQEREHRARAEGEAAGLREGLRVADEGRRAAEAARDAERAEAAALRGGVQAERERAEMERRGREAAERELEQWMAGGPLARAWRALVYRRS